MTSWRRVTRLHNQSIIGTRGCPRQLVGGCRNLILDGPQPRRDDIYRDRLSVPS